jgi:hypothetical protein
MGWVRVLVLGASLVGGLASAEPIPAARDAPYLGPIAIEVDATDSDHKILQVVETIPVRPGRLVLLYPEWIPGTHSPTNLVKRLAGLRISAAGKSVAWERDSNNLHAFRVDVPVGVSSLEIRFQHLLSLQGDSYSSVLTSRIAAISFRGAVLYPAGHDVSRIDVDASVRLPVGWRNASALRPVSEADGWVRYARVSLEMLIDSPVYAGRHTRRIDLDAGATRPVTLTVFAEDAASLAASDEQIEIHRNVVRQADRLLGARHFSHFDILLALGDEVRTLGLEHQQSSENSGKPGYFTEWKRHVVDRYMVPHEYAHSWNGKFRRPRDLWAADFNTATRNSLLWVYEGQTQYWARCSRHARDVHARRSARAARLPCRLGREPPGACLAQPAGHDAGRDLDGPAAAARLDQLAALRGLLRGRLAALARRRHADPGAFRRRALARRLRARVLRRRGGPRRAAPVRLLGRRRHAGSGAAFRLAKLLKSQVDDINVAAPLDGLTRAGWRLAWTDQQSELREGGRRLPRGDRPALLARHPRRQARPDRPGDLGRPGISRRARARADAGRRQPARVQARGPARGDQRRQGRLGADRASRQGRIAVPPRSASTTTPACAIPGSSGSRERRTG